MPKVGDKLALSFQLFNNADDKYPVAVVRDDSGAEIAGSPFTLDNVSDGLYSNYSVEYPALTDFVSIQYLVYDDIDHTIFADDQGSGLNVLYQESSGGGETTSLNTNMVGVIEGDNCQNGKTQDTIIRGEDRNVVVRLIRADNGNPYDLTDATSVYARLYNEDDTTVQVTGSITVAAAGMVTFGLTAAQTTLLLAQTPAPFLVKVLMNDGSVVLANFPYQLSVQDAAVSLA